MRDLTLRTFEAATRGELVVFGEDDKGDAWMGVESCLKALGFDDDATTCILPTLCENQDLCRYLTSAPGGNTEDRISVGGWFMRRDAFQYGLVREVGCDKDDVKALCDEVLAGNRKPYATMGMKDNVMCNADCETMMRQTARHKSWLDRLKSLWARIGGKVKMGEMPE